MKTRAQSFTSGPHDSLLAVNAGHPADDVLNHASAILSSASNTLIAGATNNEPHLVWSGIYNVQLAYGLLESVLLDIEQDTGQRKARFGPPSDRARDQDATDSATTAKQEHHRHGKA